MLSELEKTVQQHVVRLTEQLHDVTKLNIIADEQQVFSTDEMEVLIARYSEYESLNLAIQDYLLFVQDVSSLSALVQRLPLLTTLGAVDIAIQERDLTISALVSRSIYIRDGFSSAALLPQLRYLRSQMRGKDSLFTLQKVVVTQEGDQSALDSLLTEHTRRILALTDELRNESRDTVNTLAVDTLEGLDQYRRFVLSMQCYR